MFRIVPVSVCALVIAVAACSDSSPTQPSEQEAARHQLAREVRALAAARGVVPLPPAPQIRPELVSLGRALAFDKIISGNHDVSCMTCHLPSFATGDGRSLAVGAGGTGLGPARTVPSQGFVPRNTPPLFNLFGSRALFWDGRVEVDEAGNFHTPAGAQLTPAMRRVLEFGPVSAQPLFPPTAAAEMRGFSGNELAEMPADDLTGIWNGIMKRLGSIPRYRQMFEAAYPGTRFDDMNFAYATNAIAAFMIDQLTFDDTPWDRFLSGDDDALTPAQLAGAKDFLTLKCSICHNGATFSDGQFHDVALAQFGPGEGDGPSGHDDFGRMRVTGLLSDKYRFRTTPLRNVELTAPYGHAGEFATLRSFIAHYSNSDTELLDYDLLQLEPALQNTLVDNTADVIAQRDTLLNGVVIPDSVVDHLVAYMSALTDPRARNLSAIVPQSVPSGLPVDR